VLEREIRRVEWKMSWNGKEGLVEREKSGLMKEEKDSDEYEEYRVMEFKEDKEVKWNKRKGKKRVM